MRSRLGVVITAVVAGLVIFLTARLTGAEPMVMIGMDGPAEPMAWYNVAIFSVVVGLMAWALAWFLQRFDAGRAIFTVLAVIVLGGSFIPVSQLDLSGTDLAWQALLHFVVGGVILVGFWATWPAVDNADAA